MGITTSGSEIMNVNVFLTISPLISIIIIPPLYVNKYPIIRHFVISMGPD